MVADFQCSSVCCVLYAVPWAKVLLWASFSCYLRTEWWWRPHSVYEFWVCLCGYKIFWPPPFNCLIVLGTNLPCKQNELLVSITERKGRNLPVCLSPVRNGRQNVNPEFYTSSGPHSSWQDGCSLSFWLPHVTEPVGTWFKPPFPSKLTIPLKMNAQLTKW